MILRSVTLNAALAPLTQSIERLSRQVETTTTNQAVAKEHQQGADTRLNEHLVECSARWHELRNEIRKVGWKVVGLLVVCLGAVVGFAIELVLKSHSG
jgi:hypothetical protein